jgi:hypothetical protein
VTIDDVAWDDDIKELTVVNDPNEMIIIKTDSADGSKRLEGAEGAAAMGKRVGEAVIKAVGEVVAAYGPDAAYKHVAVKESLPLWTATDEEYAAAKRYIADGGKGGLGPLNEMMAYSTAIARIKRYELGIKEFAADFYAVRIGDVVLLTNPFEMYIEYADRIRMACPEAQVIDVQLAGGDCFGYLATQKAIDAGGYSTMIFSCFCDARGGDLVVDKSVALVKSMFDGS